MTKLRKALTVASISLTAMASNLPNEYASASPRCRMDKVATSDDASRVDLTVGDRKVVILGWRHLSASAAEEHKIGHYLSEAGAAAERKECALAANQLDALLKYQSSHFDPSKALLLNLQSVERELKPDSIGVEYSPELWILRRRAIESQADVLDMIVGQCSAETKSLATQVALMFPGPEYLYMVSREGSIRVVPVEDERIRSEALTLVSELHRLPKLQLSDLNERAAGLARNALATAKTGKIEDADIAAAVDAQGDNELGKRLADQLKLLQKILAINPRRNTKMAENILRGTGNQVVPIGDSHVEDLSQQIYRGCLEGKGSR